LRKLLNEIREGFVPVEDGRVEADIWKKGFVGGDVLLEERHGGI